MLEQLSAIASKSVESLGEVYKETAIKSIKDSPLQSSIETIENTSLESLQAQNIHSFENVALPTIKDNAVKPIQINDSLSLKAFDPIAFKHESIFDNIKKETGWSDQIVSSIKTYPEYEIYKNSSLFEYEVNGRQCLIRNDIDWNQTDSMGRTNLERADFRLSPIGKDGEVIELHHIGQKNDGSFAELTPDQHRGKETYSVLHDVKIESQIDRKLFDFERGEHWKTRANIGVLA